MCGRNMDPSRAFLPKVMLIYVVSAPEVMFIYATSTTQESNIFDDYLFILQYK